MSSRSKSGLVFIGLLMLTACAPVQVDMNTAQMEAEAFPRPKPDFPIAERSGGREGWVLVGYVVTPGGLVEDVWVVDSSGVDAFEKSALEAVSQWREAPGSHRELSALLNFVFEDQLIRVTRRFASLNASAHELIENGDLDGAAATLAEIRGDDDLDAVELAYSFLTEARIVGARGDRASQLQLTRKAMLNDGWWLGRQTYLAALRATTIMGLRQGDFVSAVRDYDLLTETGVGKKLAEDLEEPVEAIRAQAEEDQLARPPHSFAHTSVSTTRERPRMQDMRPDDRVDPGYDRMTRAQQAPASPPPRN